MTHRLPRLRLIAFAIGILGGALAWAAAQTTVEMSPPNARYAAQPGDHITGALTLRNDGTKPTDLSVFVSDFMLMPNGSIRPLPTGSLPSSMADWLSVSSTGVHLEGQGRTDVRYAISVPATASAGTYWAAILVRHGGSDSSAGGSGHSVGVQTVTQLAYVLLVDVGKVAPAGAVSSIEALNAQQDAGAQTIQVSFQNTGNAYMVIGGRLEVRKLDGTLEGSYPIPKAASLPGGIVHLSASIQPRIPGGDYLVTAILDYGSPDLIAGQSQVSLP